MENIKRLFFDADEAGQFIYSVMHGMTEGKAGCDGKSVYLDGGAYNWMKSAKPFPVPFFMNIIDLEADEQEKVLSEFPRVLQGDSERIKQYLKTLVPFFNFSGSETNHVITEQGLVIKPTKEIITPSQVPLDGHAGWSNPDIRALVDMDTYMAVKTANHRRFFKRFCPWYFEEMPDYAPLTPKDKSLVRKYAESIKDINPLSSKELSDLVSG